MRKDTLAVMISMIAPIAFSLAAPTAVKADSMPPKYQGEWCRIGGDESDSKWALCKRLTGVPAERQQQGQQPGQIPTPEQLNRMFPTPGAAPPQAAGSERLVLDENGGATLITTSGAKTVCEARGEDS